MIMLFSLCLEPIFNDILFHERFSVAKEIGYDAVEFWDISERDVRQVGHAAAAADIPIAVMTLIDNWGVRLCDDYSNVYKNAAESIRIGREVGCSRFIGLSGDVGAVADQKQLLTDNLRRLSELFEQQDAVLLLEPLNSHIDHKGYYLDSSAEGLEIVRNVASPGVRLLYDIYHMQVMEGNVVQTILSNIEYIGHFHAAGVPGRHEPHLGELNYERIVGALSTTAYSGYVGMEYWPVGDEIESAKQVLDYFLRCSGRR